MSHWRADDRSLNTSIAPLPIQVTGGAIMFRGQQSLIPFPPITQDLHNSSHGICVTLVSSLKVWVHLQAQDLVLCVVNVLKINIAR